MPGGIDSDDISSAVEEVAEEQGSQSGNDNQRGDGQQSEPSLGEGQDQSDAGQSQVDDSQEQATANEDVPPKLRDKDEQEVKRMYSNLEEKLGEQGQKINELTEQNAELKGRLEQMAQGQTSEEQQAEEDQSPEISTEDLPDDVMDMETEEIAQFIDNMAEQKASQMVDQELEEFKESELDPIQERERLREAQSVVEEVASDVDDFHEHSDEIQQFVDQDHIQEALANADREGKVELVKLAYDRVSNSNNGQSNSQANSKGTRTNGTSSSPSKTSLSEQVQKKGKERVKESIDGIGENDWDV